MALPFQAAASWCMTLVLSPVAEEPLSGCNCAYTSSNNKLVASCLRWVVMVISLIWLKTSALCGGDLPCQELERRAEQFLDLSGIVPLSAALCGGSVAGGNGACTAFPVLSMLCRAACVRCASEWCVFLHEQWGKSTCGCLECLVSLLVPIRTLN